jgi:hypothetical protein
VVVLAVYVIILVMGLGFGADSLTVFIDSGVIGTLILLVVYAMATVGAMRLLFFSGRTGTPRWEMVIPILALAVLAYTLYRNVYPYPSDPSTAAFWLPIVCAVWLVLAVVFVLVRPDVARRAGQRLTEEEGLRTTTREPA